MTSLRIIIKYRLISSNRGVIYGRAKQQTAYTSG